MADHPKRERQSTPVRTDQLPPLTETERARQEALNTLLQYDRMAELIDETLSSSAQFRLRPHIIQELNRISIQRIETEAGRWRDVPMRIEHSRHEPPPADQVPRLIDEMCDYVNDRWESSSAIHLAAYVMWRINWIHPFIDGNGRTTRAISYYVLCNKEGFRIPGVKTIPELVAENKEPYYKALEAADDALDAGRTDVSQMEILLKDLYARQMLEAVERADSASASLVKRTGRRATMPTEDSGASREENSGFDPDSTSSVIKQAIKAVPEVKWALGVVGAIYLVTLAISHTTPLAALFGFVLMIIGMTALLVFAYAVRGFKENGGWAATLLIWFALIFFLATATAVFAAAVSNQPWHLRDWIERQIGNPAKTSGMTRRPMAYRRSTLT